MCHRRWWGKEKGPEGDWAPHEDVKENLGAQCSAGISAKEAKAEGSSEDVYKEDAGNAQGR